MVSPNIGGILTCFSPSLDYFAISSGDGRVKIWDTSKGHLQTEFADIVLKEEGESYSKSEKGHLSVDYTCMNWISLERKLKRKLGSSLILLGTGSGDVLAWDVSAGQLKWKIDDCHPGGVTAISSSTQTSYLFSSGSDGMVCEIDPASGNLMRKFRASTNAVTSVAVSSDGKRMATAAAQVKIFSCQSHKKIQKFSGHPGAIRCMKWTGDGKFVLSCAVGERYIAVWRVDGGKKQSASGVLGMEHPAIYLDCRCVNDDDDNEAGLYVLAISEIGVCHFWYGKNIEELCNTKPTKILVSSVDESQMKLQGSGPAIYAAKLQRSAQPPSADLFVAYGLLVKPSFGKMVVHSGQNLNLDVSLDGGLLPLKQSRKSQKQSKLQSAATTLDRANAEDAVLPIPKIFDFPDGLMKSKGLKVADVSTKLMQRKDDREGVDADAVTCCIADQLRSIGILDPVGHCKEKSQLKSTSLKGIDVEAVVPLKKMKSAISPMASDEASGLFTSLVALWKSGTCSTRYVLPWICCILVNHSRHILPTESGKEIFDSLYKIAKSRGSTVQSLLKLTGQLQLVMAQIGKGSDHTDHATAQVKGDEETYSEDEGVDEAIIGDEEDEMQTSTSDDDDDGDDEA